jgi:hypothetical protein
MKGASKDDVPASSQAYGNATAVSDGAQPK